jgi:hypothetical protein
MLAVEVEGLNALLRKLKRLGAPTYRPAIAEAGALLKGVMATYPPRRHGPQPPKTMRQRVFLINAIRDGTIDFPYRRGQSPGSEGLGRRWTVQLRDDGLTAAVGNNASYAKFVQSAEEQSAYHETTGWTTDKQAAEEQAGAVRDIFQHHIRRTINSDSEAAR